MVGLPQRVSPGDEFIHRLRRTWPQGAAVVIERDDAARNHPIEECPEHRAIRLVQVAINVQQRDRPIERRQRVLEETSRQHGWRKSGHLCHRQDAFGTRFAEGALSRAPGADVLTRGRRKTLKGIEASDGPALALLLRKRAPRHEALPIRHAAFNDVAVKRANLVVELLEIQGTDDGAAVVILVERIADAVRQPFDRREQKAPNGVFGGVEEVCQECHRCVWLSWGAPFRPAPRNRC